MKSLIFTVLICFGVLPINAQFNPDDFVLLNIEMLSRAELGEALQKVNKANPKLIGVNVFFGSDRGSTDSPLETAFMETKSLILGYNLKDKRLGSNAKFTMHAADSGMTRLVGDVRLWPLYFIPYQTKWGKVQRHFSMTVASKMVDELPDYKNDGIKAIDYSEKINFNKINLSEFDLVKHRNLVKDKVVLVGFLGPGDEDKQFTPLREDMNLTEDVKDTYGTEILAYMIKTILQDSN